MEEKEQLYFVEVEQQVMAQGWCVKYWPDKKYAEFIFEGNSLCPEHFKESKLKEI